jgi:hypothetical protein
MGSSDGSGYMEKGMVHLEPLIDVDPETASEVEKILIPDKIPFQLQDFLNAVKSATIPDNPVGELAKKVKPFIEQAINTAIVYCQKYTSELEKELDTGRRGGAGIKHLSENSKFYFNKIGKRIPDEHRVSGEGIGSEIAQVLAPLIKMQTPDPVVNTEAERELEFLKSKLQDLEKTNEELQEALLEMTTKTGEESKDEL